MVAASATNADTYATLPRIEFDELLDKAVAVAGKRDTYVVDRDGGSIYVGTGSSAFRQPKFQ